AGAAGVAIVRLLESFGVGEIILCDSQGAIYEGRPRRMNEVKEIIAKKTNTKKLTGSLSEVIDGADVFIGVSVGGALTEDMVNKMHKAPIWVAMAKPEPEILPADAKRAGVISSCTGRTVQLSLVNMVLAFPGMGRGELRAGGSRIIGS